MSEFVINRFIACYDNELFAMAWRRFRTFWLVFLPTLPSLSLFSVYNMFFVFNPHSPSLFSRLNSVGRKKGKIMEKMREELFYNFIFNHSETQLIV